MDVVDGMQWRPDRSRDNGDQIRLGSIYLRDSISFLPRSEVDRCRQVSQHTFTSTLHMPHRMPRRIYEQLSFSWVCDFPLPRPFIGMTTSVNGNSIKIPRHGWNYKRHHDALFAGSSFRKLHGPRDVGTPCGMGGGPISSRHDTRMHEIECCPHLQASLLFLCRCCTPMSNSRSLAHLLPLHRAAHTAEYRQLRHHEYMVVWEEGGKKVVCSVPGTEPRQG